MQHRPDLDGLRALAITLVLFHHLHLLPGGFTGVDIFFTLSGFLITHVLHTPLPVFYTRRLFRLFPALFVTLILTLTFFPNPQTAAEALAALFSCSNFWFYFHSGYFDAGAASKPLLHTWSLAVEEQFYLFYPLLYKALPRRYLAHILAVLLVLSLLSAQCAVITSPHTAFYLTHNRAWEFLLGALLALRVERPVARWVADVGVAFGLCCMLGPAMLYSADTAFPGLAAVVPCVGAGVVIAIGSGSRVGGWMLGNGWVGWVGRISYSLYLVHWPVLVWMGEAVEELGRVNAVMVMGGLAVAMNLGVERVWRMRNREEVAREAWWRGIGLVGGFLLWTWVVASGGRLVWEEEGKGNHRSGGDLMQVVAERVLETGRRRSRVFGGSMEKLKRLTALEVGGEAGVSGALVVGDSHAGRMMVFGNYIGLKYGVRFHVVTYPGCSPLYGVNKVRKSVGVGQGTLTEEDMEVCELLLEEWRREIARGNFSHVFLVSRWSTSVEKGDYYKSGPLAEYRLVEQGQEGPVAMPGLNESRTVFERALRRTVNEIIAVGKKVVLVSEVPDVGRGLFLCKQWLRKRRGNAQESGRRTKNGQPKMCVGASREQALKRLDYTNRVIGEVAQEVNGVERIVSSGYFCDNYKQDMRHCRVVWEDGILYRDSDHLSEFGSLYLALRWELDRTAYFPKEWKFM